MTLSQYNSNMKKLKTDFVIEQINRNHATIPKVSYQ